MSPLTVLSRPHPTVWQITLSAPPDNRLTTKLLDSLTDNLDIIEAEWRRASGKRDQQGPMSDPKTFGEHKGAGAVIITGQDRFFSNGLDYSNAMANKYFFEEVYDKAMYRLLTFPLATIAAVNGHAFAGGMCLALSCDFRLMTSGKGLMCMNELAFGSPIPNSFAALLKAKIPHPSHLRETLMAKRWNQQELLEIGLVDEIVDSDKLLEAAVARGVKEGARVGAGAWGAIKDGLYHEIIDASKTFRPIALPMQEAEAFWKRVGRDKGKL